MMSSKRRAISWILIVAIQHAYIASAFAAPPVYLPHAPLPTPKDAATAAAYSANGVNATVNQTQSKQVFNWRNFDIDEGHAVIFMQPNGGAALNHISSDLTPGSANYIQAVDAARPSYILGKLESITPDGKGGSIYLINQNGILFGSHAQVNVGSLIASTLNVDDSLFLNSSIAEAIKSSKPAFACNPSCPDTVDIKDSNGNVINTIPVEIRLEARDSGDSSATIATKDGGSVIILAPKIVNEGSIVTNGSNGQVILAASKDKVYLTDATLKSATASNNLTGYLVEVQTGGTVDNIGSIVAERGNITLLGMAVNQNGRLTATTSVDKNGSIRLLARDQAEVRSSGENNTNFQVSSLITDNLLSDNVAVAKEAGTVTFGSGSITEVKPDSSGKKSAGDPSAQLRSKIEVAGKNIELKDNSILRAKGGDIQIAATDNPALLPSAQHANQTATIKLGSNAIIDVSGTTTTELAMKDSVVNVELLSGALADAPLQRGGVLARKTIQVDTDQGTPLTNITDTVNAVSRSVDERLSSGGSIKLISQGAVNIDGKAVLDISGGKIHYDSGKKTTSVLQKLNGEWVDIAQASPDVVYRGLSSKAVFVNGYDVGKNAGSLTINATSAPALAGGIVKGGVTVGPTQLAANKLPKAGTFNLDLTQFSDWVSNAVSVVAKSRFSGIAGQISDDLFRNAGLRTVNITVPNNFSVDRDARVELLPGASKTDTTDAGSSFSVKAISNDLASSIDVEGGVKVAGGAVNLETTQRLDNDTSKNSITIGSTASIDTRGLWVNDFNKPGVSALPRVTDGGAINIAGTGDVRIASDALLDASGGAYANYKGAVVAGKGGSINIAANNAHAKSNGNIAALKVDGDLRSYSLTSGGSLSLTSSGFSITQAAISNSDNGIVNLSQDFFQRGGFSSYSLASTEQGITVNSGATIDLTARNWQYNAQWLRQSSGAAISSFSTPSVLPGYLRKPVNLILTANTFNGNAKDAVAGLSLKNGAAINGDPGAAIALTAQTQLLVDGKVNAPGGSINLSVKNSDPNQILTTSPAIVLGKNSDLYAGAAFVDIPNLKQPTLHSYRTYNAGKISLNASSGYILGEDGAVLDVRGDARSVDQRELGRNGTYIFDHIVQTADAGTIHLQSTEGILFDGIYRANPAMLSGAPIANAKGGRFELVLDTTGDERLQNTNIATAPSTINVTQNAVSILPANVIQRDASGQITGVNNIYAALGSGSTGKNSTTVSAEKIKNGGFDQLSLTATNTVWSGAPRLIGKISFQGNVDLSLRQSLELASNSLVMDGGVVNLSAPYFVWGVDHPADLNFSSIQFANAIDPTLLQGTQGRLTINGDFIDLIGTLSAGGFKNLSIQSSGDIRARGYNFENSGIRSPGSLTTAVDMQLTAKQIYPATLQQFGFTVSGANGKIKIQHPQGDDGSATRNTVLSAGGELDFFAADIEQAGTVKAPLGTLNFNAGQSLTLSDHSTTSVALDTAYVPFGVIDTVTGLWTYNAGIFSINPITGQSTLVPQKLITLNAPSVSVLSSATSNAKIDVSGGGDLYAYQFIPGNGGSRDVLDPVNAGNSFAIVPTLSLAYAPFDAVDSRAGAVTPGANITLYRNGVAQTYAVLPARYAMLPGAELITPVASIGAMAAGAQTQLSDGTLVVAGKFSVANTGIQDSAWTAFSIQSRDQVFKRSEYSIRTANEFFGSQQGDSAARLPSDAGRVQILADASLKLAGVLRSAHADGSRGSELDVRANNLSIVHAASDQTLAANVLSDDALNKLGAGSLLLGGTRQRMSSATDISVAADAISIGDNVALSLPELLLAANDHIQVGKNATITATGEKARTTVETINVTGGTSNEGALLRLSSVNQADINRNFSLPTPTKGQINLDTSSTLTADKAIAVDVSKSASLLGAIHVNGGSLALSAPQISVSNNAISGVNTNTGLIVSTDKLVGTGASDLVLKSKHNLDFYQGLNLAASNLRIAAEKIRIFIDANDANKEVKLTANDTLTVAGTGAANASDSGTQTTGTLTLQGKRVVLSGNALSSAGSANSETHSLLIDNFSNITIAAGDRLVAQGNLNLTTPANNVVATTPLLVSANAANLFLNAANNVVIQGGSIPDTKASGIAEGVFGKIDLTAKKIALDTAVVLPGGIFNAHATNNDIDLRSNAKIDVAGRALVIGNKTLAMNGGAISLQADNGAIASDADALVDIAASNTTANAGSLSLISPNAALDFKAKINTSAAQQQSGGTLNIDALTIDRLSSLLASAMAAGLNEEVKLRQRSGDLTIGTNDNIQSHTIALAADQGDVDIAGTLNASGIKAGNIDLAAGNNLILRGGSVLSATASGSGERGGNIALSARDGYIDAQDNSQINLGGGANASGGKLNLRVSRTQGDFSHHVAGSDIGDGVAIKHFGATVAGANQTAIEAVKTYVATSVSAVLQTIQDDTAAFMRALTVYPNQNIAQENVLPGVEIYSGDNQSLAVDTPIDLSTWRYGSNNTPGVLTLRASKDLNIDQSVADGFIGNRLGTDRSWSLRLVAGADNTAARVTETIAKAGDMILAAGTVVRTGTGDIAVASGNNLVLGDSVSSIYTAGRREHATNNGGSYSDALLNKIFSTLPEYPIDGGDLAIAVRGNVSVTNTANPVLPMSWLYRAGDWWDSATGVRFAPTWGIAFNKFGGLGALGGGNVSVDVAGNVDHLSVAIPTTGKQVGVNNLTATSRAFSGAVTSSLVNIEGGGDLSMRVAGDVVASSFYVGRGDATVNVGGGVVQTNGVSNFIALGDTQFTINARNSVDLGAVYNPTVAAQSSTQNGTNNKHLSNFFTYSTTSALNVSSQTGSIELHNNLSDALANYSGYAVDSAGGLQNEVYPASVSVLASLGDIKIDNAMSLYPSATGNLKLIAGGGINASANGVSVLMADGNPDLLPGVQSTQRSDGLAVVSAFGLSTVDSIAAKALAILGLNENQPDNHATSPLHENDSEEVDIIAGSGDIVLNHKLQLPKAANIYAGHDIVAATTTTIFDLQNLHADDATQLWAGHDVILPDSFDTSAPAGGFRISGPGQLYLMAGHDIQLGYNTFGISSQGNLINNALSAQGASLNVMAGLGDQGPDYAAFITKYLPGADTTQDQRALVLKTFFDEVRAGGVEFTKKIGEGYARSYRAINTLFPKLTGHPFAGDLSIVKSVIQSNAGGDINILAPGGKIDVGLPVAASNSNDVQGIVVSAKGSVNTYSLGNVNVNRSRVFVQDGGDITMFSLLGNIDAGRGARTALALPPPRISRDAIGNLIVTPQAAVSGSGIQAGCTSINCIAGTAYLSAPAGVIDAGDAGIKAGNLFLAANKVLHSDVISFSGVAFGVPQATTLDIGLGAGDAAASAVQAAQELAASAASDKEQGGLGQKALALLTVDILNYGSSQDDDEKNKRRK